MPPSKHPIDAEEQIERVQVEWERCSQIRMSKRLHSDAESPRKRLKTCPAENGDVHCGETEANGAHAKELLHSERSEKEYATLSPLPEEMIAYIFNFIELAGSDWMNVFLTCRGWFRIAKTVFNPSAK